MSHVPVTEHALAVGAGAQSCVANVGGSFGGGHEVGSALEPGVDVARGHESEVANLDELGGQDVLETLW